eukprot:Lithocolla_globosa_v1_NODE_2265_length_2081_cov_15.993583.p1 type:complete len:339 gc:universal NODE_2265_length_2081_cov_15.993583:607-1623(+)
MQKTLEYVKLSQRRLTSNNIDLQMLQQDNDALKDEVQMLRKMVVECGGDPSVLPSVTSKVNQSQSHSSNEQSQQQTPESSQHHTSTQSSPHSVTPAPSHPVPMQEVQSPRESAFNLTNLVGPDVPQSHSIPRCSSSPAVLTYDSTLHQPSSHHSPHSVHAISNTNISHPLHSPGASSPDSPGLEKRDTHDDAFVVDLAQVGIKLEDQHQPLKYEIDKDDTTSLDSVISSALDGSDDFYEDYEEELPEISDQDFDFDRTKGMLETELVNRHDKNWLVARNIIKDTPAVALSLASTQQKMEFKIRQKSLVTKLAQRPQSDTLVDKHILLSNTHISFDNPG